MNVTSTSAKIAEIAADAVVVGHYAENPLVGPAAELDKATGGMLTRLIEAKELTGKKFELTVLPVPPGIAAKTIVIVGLGAKDEFNAGVAYRATAAAAKSISGKERAKVAFFPREGLPPDIIAAGIAGAMTGCVGQDLYRTKKSRIPFGEILWSGATDDALRQGKILGEAITLARRLVNEPASEIYPESFAAEATKIAKGCGVQCEVWDEKRLAAEKCGSLLAVGQASDRPARLVILTYNGGKPGDAPLALVGKGVTFDSGGLSIKPNDGMKTMKCDMAGAATVLAAVQAISQLKLPVNVIGLCGLVENLINGKAMKLGDVLTARSGKTIEVLNTDAEGRLVLADVLDVAVERKAAKIVDLATLTGACVVALGNDVAGAMSNNDAWQDEVLAASKAVGEPLWPLPMFPEYNEHIKSEVADIKNVGDGRWGGAIAGGKFLEEFVGETPWVHLDIAGPAFLESGRAWQDPGASGAFVRTLVQLAKTYKPQ
jgi:leucyl aminopeptidase